MLDTKDSPIIKSQLDNSRNVQFGLKNTYKITHCGTFS